MQRRTVVYTDQTEAGELRTVSVRTTDHGVEIVERTTGPDTRAIFGDPVHKQVLTLSDEAESPVTRSPTACAAPLPRGSWSFSRTSRTFSTARRCPMGTPPTVPGRACTVRTSTDGYG